MLLAEPPDGLCGDGDKQGFERPASSAPTGVVVHARTRSVEGLERRGYAVERGSSHGSRRGIVCGSQSSNEEGGHKSEE